jgi:hypothetical protein
MGVEGGRQWTGTRWLFETHCCGERAFAQRGRLLEATVYNIEADMCLAAWWTLRHGQSEAERLVLVYWFDK